MADRFGSGVKYRLDGDNGYGCNVCGVDRAILLRLTGTQTKDLAIPGAALYRLGHPPRYSFQQTAYSNRVRYG